MGQEAFQKRMSNKVAKKHPKCLQKEPQMAPPGSQNGAPEPPNLTQNLTFDPSEGPGVPQQASEVPPQA